MKCAICSTDDKDTAWSWTDTHGIAQCFHCGAPYRIYHYKGDTTERLDLPPELLIRPEYVELCRQYWHENKRRMPSGFSFPGGQELASREDEELFYNWLQAHKLKETPNA